MGATIAVRERPILFSGEMVRAIIDGRKAQTRRVVKPQPFTAPLAEGERYVTDEEYRINAVERRFPCPYGQPGDRLWVRETLRGDGEPGGRRLGIVRYGADGEMVLPCCRCGSVHCECAEPGAAPRMDVIWEWVRPVLPSIHMPRWASRITLELTDVRVERLQEISEADCRAEGVPEAASIGKFRVLWDSINAARGYGWDANPWVWALSFRVVPNA